jgi:hypothetical protein
MYTNSELLDSVITEMYEMFKALISGNYVRFCAAFADIISKLGSLREGLKKQTDADNACIEDLKNQLKRATTIEPEPGGETVGGETVKYNYDTK